MCVWVRQHVNWRTGDTVMVVEDGCATLPQDAHRAALENFDTIFGQAKSADEIIGEPDS